MTKKECIWKLIYGLDNGSYDIKYFCDEFYKVYDLEIGYDDYSEDDLNECEDQEFSELGELVGRYSPFEEDFKKCKNAFVNEEQIREKVSHILLKKKMNLM